MSSPFSSALTELDVSLQAVQAQLDCLRAALEVDADQLSRSLTNARQRAAMVRDLIHAECPDADWKDRRGLDEMIDELETAAARRNQEKRRAKLLDLADELDAGTVKHRLEARTKALNALRLEAVEELLTAAAFPEQVKDLPGPKASEWLHWACSLHYAEDASVLTTLSRDFAAVERFTGEIEESYWKPGQRVSESPGQSSEPSVRPAEKTAESPAFPSSEPLAPASSPESPVLQSAKRPSVDPLLQPAQEVLPSFGEHVLRKSHVAAWVATASIVVLFAIFFGAHYFHATTSSTAGGAAATSGAQVAGAVQGSESPQTGINSTALLLHRQPVEGAQQQILLEMERCERVNPESIECWGYVSNLGDKSSDVSLHGVDVIDGKGNAFSLSNGQFDFSSGPSASIPAGSRDKYTVKIPDKHREVRTLTLYVDLSNPRGLEYTFRNVPVAD
jgi:hypothetical protein